MKKTFYIFLLLFLGAGITNAQQDSFHKTKNKHSIFSSAGIFAGTDLTSLSGDAPKDVSYGIKPGLLGGISVEFNISDDIKLLFQPMYSMKHTKVLYDIGEKDPLDTMRMNFEYLRFPVILKVNAFNGRTYFLSGLETGYLLSSSLYDKEKVNGETDILYLMNRFDVSALFGFGVNFCVFSNLLYIELRYEQSLLNMSKTEENLKAGNLPLRFRLGGLQLLTGYNFSF